MSENTQVTVDAQLLLSYMDAQGLNGAVQVNRGQEHMGGLIVDSALQRRNKYGSTVAPRVAKIIEAWPKAVTTTGFRRLAGDGDTSTFDWSLNTGLAGLGKVIDWSSPTRLVQMAETATVFADHGIDTTDQLREALEDEHTRAPLRAQLRRIRNIGPKTLDYFDILCGITEATAVDSRIRLAATRAGIERQGYDHLREVMFHAANTRSWRLSDLDAVLWAAHED
ncbi:hypothetical protein [Micrococcus terreus]|uniref:Uncharacterized protein n=1 Tax=Micrococcus terreus TaxID=574650 RepID=A0A1I7MPK5_9MICC|nr:hypothetical protein [Micrococcus terreus]SFV23828.1 hypothetical protein SAMN04487966_108148 [Micrococcus terreus]